MKFVVTGTGRCGTQWAQSTLQQAGFTVTHQKTFDHSLWLSSYTPTHCPPLPNDIDGECSFGAVPWLPVLYDLKRVLLVRHPVKVAASWVSVGMFDSRITSRSMYAMLKATAPEVLDELTPLDRAARFWHSWNIKALPHVDHILELERTTGTQLVEAVGGTVDETFDATTSEAVDSVPRKRHIEARWSDLSPQLRHDCMDLAVEMEIQL